MPRLALMLSACATALAALSLTACNQNDDIDALDSSASNSMPLVATHAFDIPPPSSVSPFRPMTSPVGLGLSLQSTRKDS